MCTKLAHLSSQPHTDTERGDVFHMHQLKVPTRMGCLAGLFAVHVSISTSIKLFGARRVGSISMGSLDGMGPSGCRETMCPSAARKRLFQAAANGEAGVVRRFWSAASGGFGGTNGTGSAAGHVGLGVAGRCVGARRGNRCWSGLQLCCGRGGAVR